MATSTVSRDFDIARIIADYKRRIAFLERRLLSLFGSATPESVATQGCRVSRNAVQAIAHAAFVPVSFNTEIYDNNAMHDNGVNPTRITINVPGIYSVGGNIEMQSGNDYVRVILVIRVNGATAIAFNQTPGVALNVTQKYAISCDWQFSAGDYIELQVFHTNGAALPRNVLATPEYSPQFWATRIGG
jgi:hypothetical protein